MVVKVVQAQYEDGALQTKIRDLDESEMEEFELATDEDLGEFEPNQERASLLAFDNPIAAITRKPYGTVAI